MRKKKNYTINRVRDIGVFYNTEDLAKMHKHIGKVGKKGMLHFIVRNLGKDGWMAQCEEISGIITGGPSSNPTQDEINVSVRDAVYSAFGIREQIRIKKKGAKIPKSSDINGFSPYATKKIIDIRSSLSI